MLAPQLKVLSAFQARRTNPRDVTLFSKIRLVFRSLHLQSGVQSAFSGLLLFRRPLTKISAIILRDSVSRAPVTLRTN